MGPEAGQRWLGVGRSVGPDARARGDAAVRDAIDGRADAVGVRHGWRHDEVGGVVRHARGAPVGGCYTHGEIARTRGLAGYHNQTFVVLAVT